MTNQTKNRPVATIRDGALKAAIWKNESESSVFYNVTFARTYKDSKDKLQDADSFSGSQLLRLARLADQVYAKIGELGQEDRQAENAPEDPAPQDHGAAAKQPETEGAA